MRTLVNLIIMFALPFILAEDKTAPELPPSQRIQEIRADTSLQQQKIDFATISSHDNAQKGNGLGIFFPVVVAQVLE